MCRSEPQMPARVSRTRMAPGSTSGTGYSRSSNSPPYARSTATRPFMSALPGTTHDSVQGRRSAGLCQPGADVDFLPRQTPPSWRPACEVALQVSYGTQSCSSQTTLDPATILMSRPAQIFPCTRPGERATLPSTAMMLPWMTALQQLAPPPPPEVETSFPTLRSRLALPASVRMSAPPERLTLPPILTTKVTLLWPFVLKLMVLPLDVTSPVTQMTF